MLAPLLYIRLGGLMRQIEPRIVFRQESINIRTRSHPRRVTHLEVETTAGHHCGEIEIPVEESLFLRDMSGNAQPRVTV